jgi:integrase
MTLGQALTRYEEEETSQHHGSETEKSHINVIRAEPLTRRTLTSIDRDAAKALRDGWISRGYAIATVNRRLTILHSVYATAATGWKMRGLENPFAKLKLKGASERERRVSDKEFAAVIAASDSAELAAMAAVALETAIRRGELCKLERTMLEFRKNGKKKEYIGAARLPGTITKDGKSRRFTKNGKPRNVPLSPHACQVLRTHPNRKDGRVFGLVPHSVTQAWDRAVRRARAAYVADCKATGKGRKPISGFLVDLNFHDLRHEATSRLATKFGLHELMKITGHSDAKMLMRYYHPDATEFAKRLGAGGRK